ncbi:peptidoglycan binding protein CsiV [Aliivibrio sp. S4TY2]|uniref:peptidoglycan binding protein CsiV n=1 Tax=unclassified Aliivibrio TaxID=2645654 RepID=UPI0023791D4B|nr:MULTISPECIES: peptidoglycan binding protein CsiV [unclassified Aliivibrio]MDD9157925.1 peptidoglycan binding protein CsiV [Aliivibrio sp. S4TY2]MDD9161858.1 peptidoglycan binding protein CsiV [Aliivibrio sp. S4TY1]MDD9165925.1 peptidoglycan binding protein CsiV [Aliivibrio sp. S4MY2]MDD9186975.1 peptidoglycan binding protein CsiV [Aliivibrio sp. S4MY3]MDD9204142.1 peptidoglycan binding protein CsiV [Aliivibrio sp. S4MY1]
MKKIIYALILLASWPSFARQFDVEVIIFKRNVEPSSYQESWPDILAPINLDRAFSYRDKKMMSSNGASLLPSGYYKLNEAYTKLQNHAGFKPLVHVAWRQGDSGASRSPIFHIQAGQDFSDRFVADGRTIEDANADLSLVPLDAPKPALIEDTDTLEADTTAATSSSGPLLELDGTMQVYVQHYLYVNTILDLKVPGQHEFIVNTPTADKEEMMTETISSNDSDIQGDTTETNAVLIEDPNADVQLGHLEDVTPETEVKEFLKSYRMEEKRKMRSGETHYIDHPLMGMIIQVRKV